MSPAEVALMNAHRRMISNTRAALASYDVTNPASVARLLWAQRTQALVASKRLAVTRARASR